MSAIKDESDPVEAVVPLTIYMGFTIGYYSTYSLFAL